MDLMSNVFMELDNRSIDTKCYLDSLRFYWFDRSIQPTQLGFMQNIKAHNNIDIFVFYHINK